MLKHLSIRNYALIDHLNLDLPNGMITITGETGAGKSIMLGALKLVLGERVDLKSLKNSDEKCIIEADFLIKKNNFLSFFIEHDLEFDENTIIRREILPSGKSRAFINDSPVTLDILQKLTSRLLDIHSQFETAQLLNEKFQLDLLDHFSSLQEDKNEYEKIFTQYHLENRKLQELKDKLLTGSKDQEYSKYLLEELEKAELDELQFDELQSNFNLMKNSEFLAQILSESKQIIDNEDVGLLQQIQVIISRMDKASQVSIDVEKLLGRINGIKAELQDISFESENLLEKLEFDPIKFEEYNQKINLIHSLLYKHKVSDIKELITVRDDLAKNHLDLEQIESLIFESEKKIEECTEILSKRAKILSSKRLENAPVLEKNILKILSNLGMDKSQIEIKVDSLKDFTPSGTDKVSILFSANVGMPIQPIVKAISGGERSRVMLAIKKIMAENVELPTLILDEIDTGVSGRIANEMGKLMRDMSKSMQIVTITHLPQVAAKGKIQLKVEKQENKGKTTTGVRKLSEEERIEEIAQLISGSDVTESARQQAIELFK
ncbi:DNA repair protein RecN [Apibacter muscae]|uniref:DNA repair protein RecN n=1 Tax=Apibacter muscae TaxID=2509004 RepID=A0A563D7T5_9FLAO|nr:DNA repair protein RecN [Apibacter muscae]TWP26157.1 DNA repair protein RecN [Apibacter muscae]